MKNAFRLLAIGTLLAPTLANSGPPNRISSKVVDLGKVHRIVMSPGMLTLIEIPEPITGVRTGSPEVDLKVIVPKEPNNEVDLILQRADARPTNLIIRAGNKKYIFDVVPSSKGDRIHQDSYQVLGAYGAAELDTTDSDVHSTSRATVRQGT